VELLSRDVINVRTDTCYSMASTGCCVFAWCLVLLCCCIYFTAECYCASTYWYVLSLATWDEKRDFYVRLYIRHKQKTDMVTGISTGIRSIWTRWTPTLGSGSSVSPPVSPVTYRLFVPFLQCCRLCA